MTWFRKLVEAIRYHPYPPPWCFKHHVHHQCGWCGKVTIHPCNGD